MSPRICLAVLLLAAPGLAEEAKAGGGLKLKVEGKVELPKVEPPKIELKGKAKVTGSAKGSVGAEAQGEAGAKDNIKAPNIAGAIKAAKEKAEIKGEVDVPRPAAEAKIEGGVKFRIGMLDLPRVAAEARAIGIAEADLRATLLALRAKEVPAAEAHVILKEEVAACKRHGPVDNFGAFVQVKLDAGLRGKALAAVIRAEHKARGKGKPEHAAPEHAAKEKHEEKAKGEGTPKAHAKGHEKGKAQEKGERP